jgi:asparaginyl-tRNA synthetase
MTKSKSKKKQEHLANLGRINANLYDGVFGHYKKIGLQYVDVPEIVGITGACENIDTLFKVQNRLSLPLFMTQTGQLSLEQALQSFRGVYTVIHSGRDEEQEDRRHLRQFRLTEEEFDCTLADMTRKNYDEEKMFKALLTHIQKAVQAMIERILKKNGKILKRTYRRDVGKLAEAAKKDFHRIEYEKAVSLLNKKGFPKLAFGDDLKAEHEAKIVTLLNKKNEELPVFITHYPKEIKFFNMKVYTSNPRVVLSADLIFPYAGEGTGAAVREHDFGKLNDRLLTSTMYKLHLKRGGKYEDFKWYLDIIKNKRSNPHAGYGIGNERVLQYVLGETDIRNCSVFSLLNQETQDWSSKRYGMASVMSQDKKQILLSIGRQKNKEILLKYIRKIAAKDKFILYSTEHTYQFLKKNKVMSLLVHKISQVGKTPNIGDLLRRRTFDLIINIPNRAKMTDSILTQAEFTDGRLIRKAAVETGVSLVTDLEVAAIVIDNLAKGNS